MDGDVEIIEAQEAEEGAREYRRSGYTDTEIAAQPARGALHRRRLQKKMAKRPAARTMLQMADKARTDEARRRNKDNHARDKRRESRATGQAGNNGVDGGTSKKKLLRLRAQQLRDMCATQRLATTGTKAVLVKRLVDARRADAAPAGAAMAVLSKLNRRKKTRIGTSTKYRRCRTDRRGEEP